MTSDNRTVQVLQHGHWYLVKHIDSNRMRFVLVVKLNKNNQIVEYLDDYFNHENINDFFKNHVVIKDITDKINITYEDKEG